MKDLQKPIVVVGITAVVLRVTHAGEKAGIGMAVVGGLTATEIAAFGGLAVAALSFLVNAVTNFYFKWKHYKLAEKLGRANQDE